MGYRNSQYELEMFSLRERVMAFHEQHLDRENFAEYERQRMLADLRAALPNVQCSYNIDKDGRLRSRIFFYDGDLSSQSDYVQAVVEDLIERYSIWRRDCHPHPEQIVE